MPLVQQVITVLEVLGVLAVLFVAASVATRAGDVLAEAPGDDPDLDLPAGPLQPEDIKLVRFAMVLRGYRMREVDEVLARVTADLAARDERLLALEQALVTVVEPHVDEAERRLSAPALEQQAADAEPQGEAHRTSDVEAASDPAPLPVGEPDVVADQLPAASLTAGGLTGIAPPADVAPSEPVPPEHSAVPEVAPAPEPPAPAPPVFTALDPTSLVPTPLRTASEVAPTEARPAAALGPDSHEPDPVTPDSPELEPLWPQPDLEPEPEPLPPPPNPDPLDPAVDLSGLSAPFSDLHDDGFPEVHSGSEPSSRPDDATES